MKNKRKKYAKILLAVIVAFLIGLCNLYVYSLKNIDNSNSTKNTIKNEDEVALYNRGGADGAGTTRKPPGMPEEAKRHSQTVKAGGTYNPNKDRGNVRVPTLPRTSSGGNNGGHSKGGNKKKSTATTTTTKKTKGGKIYVANNGDSAKDFRSVEISGVLSNGKWVDREWGDTRDICVNKKCSLQVRDCYNDCKTRLKAETADGTISNDKIGWTKDGIMTNLKGRTIDVETKGGVAVEVWKPCIVGRTCPGTTTTSNTGSESKDQSGGGNTTKPSGGGAPTSPSGGNGGGSGGGSSTTTPTTKSSSDSYPDKINKEVFAKGEQYGGETIKCGDKLYVTACNKDSDPICQVTKINGKKVTNTFIKKSNYTENEADTGCYQNATRYVKKDSSYYTNIDLTKGKKTFPCGEQVTLKKTMDVACNSKSCEVEYKGSTIYLEKDALITYKPTCSNDPAGTCTSSEKQNNVIGDVTMKLCKNDDTPEKRNQMVTCAQDYKLYYKLAPDGDYCKENNDSTCYREYIYSCVYGKAPGISASAGIIGSNGLGLINITGYDYGNVGLKGYFLSAGNTPSENYDWKSFDSNNKATESQPAGTYFVWAKNNKGIMSNSVLVKVYDADLSTTMNAFGVVDENSGNVLSLKQLDNKVANADQIVDAKYALLSNKLLADSNGTGYDQLTTAYEITTTSNKIALYATLTSDDASYLEGYEPRTVDLDYGENSIIIGIINKDGKQRFYTFIVNRVDDRNNDNTLSSIKLSKGKINFDPYVTNYDVEISKNTKKVSINAELNSENAGFVVGYEPRTIEITEDKQSAIIKVMSDAGNVRSYVITFIKKDYVEEPGNSAYLSSLTVPGTQLSFDRDVYEYTVTVPYETDRVPIYAFAESENAEVNIGDSTFLEVGTNLVEIEVKNGKNVKIYNLYIIRKEAGLDISNSTRLGMLSIKGYDINFDPNVLDYTVKIKREKTLMIAATPESNRADIYMYGNNDLTGFSTVRVKVIAENGLTQVYSIDIKKDAYNKKLEIIVASVGCLIIVISGIIIITTRKKNKKKEYMEG